MSETWREGSELLVLQDQIDCTCEASVAGSQRSSAESWEEIGEVCGCTCGTDILEISGLVAAEGLGKPQRRAEI